MTTRRSVLTHSAALVAALTLPRGAFAQSYPSRLIKIIVPFPPGGPGDAAMRLVQMGMEKPLGQTIVIENVPGVGGSIGAQQVKRSEPDGHTLLQVANPLTAAAAVRPANAPDLLRDFEPIGQTAESVFTLCVSKEVGVKTLDEFIAKAKANPGKLSIGHSGVGSIQHLIIELFKSFTGIELTNVSYRGEAQGAIDLIAGRIDAQFLITARQYLQDDKVIALGHTGDGPWFNLPGVKSLKELGLKELIVPGWNGLMAPKGTPPAVIAKLSTTLDTLLKSEEAKKALNPLGLNPGIGTPQQLTKIIERDMRLFTTVIRERNLKFEAG
jgi:tripartite-type tricarboxylate transporter receptor subunit TctC